MPPPPPTDRPSPPTYAEARLKPRGLADSPNPLAAHAFAPHAGTDTLLEEPSRAALARPSHPGCDLASPPAPRGGSHSALRPPEHTRMHAMASTTDPARGPFTRSTQVRLRATHAPAPPSLRLSSPPTPLSALHPALPHRRLTRVRARAQAFLLARLRRTAPTRPRPSASASRLDTGVQDPARDGERATV